MLKKKFMHAKLVPNCLSLWRNKMWVKYIKKLVLWFNPTTILQSLNQHCTEVETVGETKAYETNYYLTG